MSDDWSGTRQARPARGRGELLGWARCTGCTRRRTVGVPGLHNDRELSSLAAAIPDGTGRRRRRWPRRWRRLPQAARRPLAADAVSPRASRACGRRPGFAASGVRAVDADRRRDRRREWWRPRLVLRHGSVVHLSATPPRLGTAPGDRRATRRSCRSSLHDAAIADLESRGVVRPPSSSPVRFASTGAGWAGRGRHETTVSIPGDPSNHSEVDRGDEGLTGLVAGDVLLDPRRDGAPRSSRKFAVWA